MDVSFCCPVLHLIFLTHSRVCSSKTFMSRLCVFFIWNIHFTLVSLALKHSCHTRMSLSLKHSCQTDVSCLWNIHVTFMCLCPWNIHVTQVFLHPKRTLYEMNSFIHITEWSGTFGETPSVSERGRCKTTCQFHFASFACPVKAIKSYSEKEDTSICRVWLAGIDNIIFMEFQPLF